MVIAAGIVGFILGLIITVVLKRKTFRNILAQMVEPDYDK